MTQDYSSHTALTGDRPTGPLHLGHYVGSIQNRVRLQNESKRALYMVADVQALTDNADNPQKVRDNVLQVVLDNLACGIDPEKTIMFIQSEIPEIAELTIFFLNLVTIQRLGQNPTIREEARQKGWNSNLINSGDTEAGKGTPAGFFCYPVSQAADILFCKSSLIPVGEDQKPMIEQANEIVRDFNRIYGETFKPIQHLIGDTGRLVGIDGNAKMSKSLGNCIYLSDSDTVIEKQVMQMYTDPEHTSVDKPGKVEGNVVFTYLDIFDPNKEEVAVLKAQYQKGGLGDVVLKKRLTKILQDIIRPIRERREALAKDPEKVMKILEKGTARARAIAQETMAEVREKMKINYF